jgi:hypothetical protein
MNILGYGNIKNNLVNLFPFKNNYKVKKLITVFSLLISMKPDSFETGTFTYQFLFSKIFTDKRLNNNVKITCNNNDTIISKENKFPFGFLSVKFLFDLILYKIFILNFNNQR